MKAKLIITSFALAALASSAAATPWNNGATDGVVNIPADYATLQACASAFSAVGGGINANWTIQVANGTYPETATCYFGNTIAPGKTVTLKPAGGATVTFNFTGADNGTNTINGGLV